MSKTRTIGGFPFQKYIGEHPESEQVIRNSTEFLSTMSTRRSIRDFSNKPVPLDAINNILLTASSAPSGAHKQPWIFCVVSNPKIKKEIRIAAEKEEYEGYNGKMPPAWLQDIKPFQTNWEKPFLEIAPYLIVIFRKVYEDRGDGNTSNNYYVTESVGLACGFLLTAIHQAGLVALTHTPSPMNFLNTILNRPRNERPFLIVPVGYPAEESYVPKLKRKKLNEIAVYYK